jgi:hypothetical protein
MALQMNEPKFDALNKLSDEQWRSLLGFGNLSQLTLPIAQLPATGFPQWVIERLAANIADNALRFERIKSTYREAACALDEADVEHLVIKGFSQSPEYVPDPRLRPQSDIDLMCAPKSILAARDALYDLGYKSESLPGKIQLGDHLPTLVRLGDWQWKGNYYDPEMPLGIDLHFCLWNDGTSKIHIPEVEMFWERRTTRQVGDLTFSCMARVDHLAHLALHILRNLLSFNWIVHHVRELAFFLHAHADDESFWQEWQAAYSPQMRSCQAIAFHHARSWFDCRLHPLASGEIDKLPKNQRSWLEYFTGSALESMFQHNKDSLWLHLNFVNSLKEKSKIVRLALIPSTLGSTSNFTIHTHDRKLLEPSDRPRCQQYIAYLFNRAAYWGVSGLVTLNRWMVWRLSRFFRFRAGIPVTVNAAELEVLPLSSDLPLGVPAKTAL